VTVNGASPTFDSVAATRAGWSAVAGLTSDASNCPALGEGGGTELVEDEDDGDEDVPVEGVDPFDVDRGGVVVVSRRVTPLQPASAATPVALRPAMTARLEGMCDNSLPSRHKSRGDQRRDRECPR